MRDALRSKFIGALVGAFAGDALGMPVEGCSGPMIRAEFGRVDAMLEARMGRGTYTDDTEMMIGLAETLDRCGRVEPEVFAERLVANYSAQRGYGGGSRVTLAALERGAPWTEAAYAAFPEGSWGNGAAMRVAPVGVMFHHDIPELLRQAALSAKVTHTHPHGIEGAKLQALAVGLAARLRTGKLERDSYTAALKTHIADAAFQRAIDRVAERIEQPHDPDHVACALGTETIALRSVPVSIYCFLRFSDDFRQAVSEAVSLGGDTDTVGAMTGAICGAYRGVEAIPPSWRDVMENGPKGRDYISDLAERLYYRWMKKRQQEKERPPI